MNLLLEYEFSTIPDVQPTVELVKNKESYLYNQTIILTATIQDTDIGDELTLTISNDHFGTHTETITSDGENKTFNFTFVADEAKNHVFTATVKDQVGKQATATISAMVYPLRTQPPKIDPIPESRTYTTQTLPNTVITTDLPTTVYNGTNFYLSKSYVQYVTLQGETYVVVEVETNVLYARVGDATPKPQEKKSKLPWWIFVVIGCAALLIIVTIIAFIIWKKRQDDDTEDSEDITISMQEENAVLSPDFLSSVTVITDNPLYNAGESIDGDPEDVFRKDFEQSDSTIEGVFLNESDATCNNIFLNNNVPSESILTQNNQV